MKKTKVLVKRIIVFIMAIAMVLLLIPSAFAEEVVSDTEIFETYEEQSIHADLIGSDTENAGSENVSGTVTDENLVVPSSADENASEVNTPGTEEAAAGQALSGESENSSELNIQETETDETSQESGEQASEDGSQQDSDVEGTGENAAEQNLNVEAIEGGTDTEKSGEESGQVSNTEETVDGETGLVSDTERIENETEQNSDAEESIGEDESEYDSENDGDESEENSENDGEDESESEEESEEDSETEDSDDTADEEEKTETSLSAYMEDGTVVTVTGNLPEGIELSINAVPEESVAGFVDENKKIVFALDISLWLDGEEYEPEEAVKVSIDSAGSENTESGKIEITHINDENVAEEIVSEITDDGGVEFEAESFSVYIGTVTVNNAITLTSVTGYKFYSDAACNTEITNDEYEWTAATTIYVKADTGYTISSVTVTNADGTGSSEAGVSGPDANSVYTLAFSAPTVSSQSQIIILYAQWEAVNAPADAAYIISIPPTITVTDNGGENMHITTKTSNFESGNSLTVSVSSANNFQLKLSSDSSQSIRYSIKNGSSEGSSVTGGEQVVNHTGDGEYTDTLYLEVDSGSSPQYAGNYTDTLTFTITFS